MEVQRALDANISSGSLEVNGEMVAIVRPNGTDANSIIFANITGSSRVEVSEGQDVTLAFVIEAYPPISNQDWTTPTHVNNNNNNTVYQESYTANGFRLAC